MIEQHDQCGMMLQRMAELTNQFAQAGADGPPAITEALSALSSMERDTRQHVYKENCLLAFRAEQAETSLRARKPRG
jgi:iron-sulfur cluster repair protein YtfE (RIC family)